MRFRNREGMNAEDVEKICRFCLESKKTKENPLLAPCECKGSIEFVHLVCLNRWRFQNPERNKIICLLCHTNYILENEDELEIVPTSTLLYVNLEYPILTSMVLHYVLAITQFTILNSRSSNFIPYELIQVANHCLMCLQILIRFKVVNWSRYFRGWDFEYRWTLFLVHVLLLSCGLFGSAPFTLFLSNFILPMYWKLHIRILQEINDEYVQQRQ